MTLEQSTAAAINEIDRTLKSLGIRNSYPGTYIEVLPCSLSEPAQITPLSRSTAAVQTPTLVRAAAGTQSSFSTRATGVQHSPYRKTTASQTDGALSGRVVSHEAIEALTEMSAALASTTVIEESASEKLDALQRKLTEVTNKFAAVSQLVGCLHRRADLRALEHEEASQRALIVAGESALRCDAMQQLHRDSVGVLHATVKRVLSERSEAESRSSLELHDATGVNLCHVEAAASLTELEDLLYECQRALRE